MKEENMTHTKKNWMRAFALILAVLTVFGIVPIMSASASTIGDGSTTCEVVPINQRQFLLTTTAGKGSALLRTAIRPTTVSATPRTVSITCSI